MPIFDQPDWVRHEGAAIFGVDIDNPGERLATCGADNRIRIWALRPIVSEAAELDPAVAKLLATLSDSIHPVNCVRFAPAARLLAAGTDDAEALVYELREGRVDTVFGSSDAPRIENWRLRSRLRGHEVNVADVAWAPDSRRLATASVDNRVKIWDTSSGHCIRTLEGHVGFVKGVAWDPFDFFLASQGDREVIIWRLEDGSPVARISEPFASAPTVSFALRLAWSPDGQTLAAPNGFDNGVHVVPLIRRNAWGGFENSLVGHRGSVVAARYNPHLYYPRKQPGGEEHQAAAAAAAGGGGSTAGGGSGDNDDAAGPVVAVGATDKIVTVWHPAADHPLMICKGFFRSMINDLAWSPDGRVVVAASQDGTVTVTVFGEEELGRRVPDAEVAELHAQLYGDPKLRNQKTALTAAPDLLQLETRAQVDSERQDRLNSRLDAVATGAAPATSAGSGLLRPASGPVRQASTFGAAAAPTALPPMPAVAAPPPPQQSSGGAPGGAAVRSTSPTRTATHVGRSGRDPDLPPAKRPALHPTTAAPGGQLPTASGAMSSGGPRPFGAPSGTISVATGVANAVAREAAGLGGAAALAQVATPPAVLVPPDAIRPLVSKLLYVQSAVTGGRPLPVELQALNTARDSRQRPAAELVCLVGAKRLWQDTVMGQVVALAGSSRLAAAATSLGDLLIYTPAGRRLFTPIVLGAPASSFFHVAPDSCTLMAVLADGQLKVWDFAAGERCVLETSLAPVLLGQGQQQRPLRVCTARLLASGSPLVVLSNGYGYVHHAGLRCWMRVVDDAFPASIHTTGLLSTSGGELARLQAGVAQRRNPREVLEASQAHAARPAVGARSEQALLEHNLAAAAALQSPNEWRLWLITYVRQLAANGDEPRLRELIAELLGPVRWSAATHTAPATTAGATSAATAAAGSAPGTSGRGAGGGWEPALASSVVGRWQPSILGFDKRRLLRELVLKEVNKNRVFQQLVAEVLDLLKYVEGGDQRAARPGAASGEAAGGGEAAHGVAVSNTGGSVGGGRAAGPGAGAQLTTAEATALNRQPQPMALG